LNDNIYAEICFDLGSIIHDQLRSDFPKVDFKKCWLNSKNLVICAASDHKIVLVILDEFDEKALIHKVI
jgi:hypothetical protein